MLGMKHLKFVSERESDQYKQQINNNLFSIPTMLLLLRLYLLAGNHQRIAILKIASHPRRIASSISKFNRLTETFERFSFLYSSQNIVLKSAHRW